MIEQVRTAYHPWGVVIALIAAVISGTAMAGPSGPARVYDGRTLVIGDETVRLYGIDAPDLDQTCTANGKTYPCGNIARTALLDLTAGARVDCTLRGKDDEGRLVALCLADGFDLSLNMVHTGWAVADRGVTARYVVTEDKARLAGRGLWRGEFVRPWLWRKERGD